MTRPVAIVTGGARGIGHACVEALADIGFNLVVADVAEEAGRGLSDEMIFHGARSVYHRCDIADLAGHQKLVDAAMAAFGRIDCLVNNAGIGAPVRGDLLDLKPENFDRVLDVNLRGTVFLSQAVARAMLAKATDHAKSIITITSVSADAASPGEPLGEGGEAGDVGEDEGGVDVLPGGARRRVVPVEGDPGHVASQVGHDRASSRPRDDQRRPPPRGAQAHATG